MGRVVGYAGCGYHHDSYYIYAAFMRRIISFILVIALLAPNAARWLSYASCRTSDAGANANGFCECMLSNLVDYGDESTLPDKQKEISEQTDWKYISQPVIHLERPVLIHYTRVNNRHNFLYSTTFVSEIFHPPARA